MTEDKSKIPFGELYIKYLNIASIRFSMQLYDVRDAFGLYTIEQWEELFSTIGEGTANKQDLGVLLSRTI